MAPTILSRRSALSSKEFVDLSSILHGFSSRVHWIAMLAAYLDESESKDRFAFVVASVIAPTKTWAALLPNWSQRLYQDGISVFHATDCENLRGEFEKWDKARATRLITELIDILDLNDFAGIISGVVSEGYYQRIDPLIRSNDGNVYALCLLGLLQATVRSVKSFPDDEKIVFTYEKRPKITGVVNEVFDHIRAATDADFPFEGRQRLFKIIPGAKRDDVPLQIADLLAYEGSKHIHNTARTMLPTRKSFERLRANHIDYAGVFDDQALTTLARWLKDALENGECRET